MKLRCLNRLSRHEINISNLSFLIYPPIFQIICNEYIYIYMKTQILPWKILTTFWTGDNKIMHCNLVIILSGINAVLQIVICIAQGKWSHLDSCGRKRLQALLHFFIDNPVCCTFQKTYSRLCPIRSKFQQLQLYK